MTTTTPELSFAMPTKLGAVHVLLQDGHTAYVRAGTGDTGSSSAPADEFPAIGYGRGAAGSIRAHFVLINAAGWEALKPTSTYVSLHREGGGNVTETMRQTVIAAITEALDRFVTADALVEAQRQKNAGDAAARRIEAANLRAQADQLEAQADALEASPEARVFYGVQRLRSGAEQQATAVRTADGELLFVDGGEHGQRRYRDESAEWTERH